MQLIVVFLYTFLGVLHLVAAKDRSLLDVYNNMDEPIDPSDYIIHDPSRILKKAKGTVQMLACTGQAQEDGYDCGLETWYRKSSSDKWQPGQCLFRDKPSWIREEIPTQGGAFWAPELVNRKTMFYSVADFSGESPWTCVGLARAKGKFPKKLSWKDSGKPVSCVNHQDFDQEVSAIDPTTIKTPDGDLYLITGGGVIHGTQLNKKTYMPVSGEWFGPDASGWKRLARGPRRDGRYEWVEAAYAHYHDGWYFLYVNWDACCSGVRSTYNIRVGRSRSPLGTYRDKTGRNMYNGGGSLLLETDDFMIGPGHTGIWTDDEGKDVISFHYYDRRREGAPWVAERRLTWEDNWPVVGEVLSN